ncbi:Cytosolic purine 5'-nucleotidase [Taenia solium]|eukprot:TsM_000405500 transcript=TsM_000405500 gene=TsM_000405500
MNEAYGLLGSIFRHGSRLTTFSSQAMQFADLYSYSCYNLIYYPLCYMFRAPPMLMPHESTVPHEETTFESFKDLEDSPCGLRRRTTTEAEMAQHIKAMLLKRMPDSMMATHSSAGEAEEEDEKGEDGENTPIGTTTFMTITAPAALKNLSSHMETLNISAITSSSSSSSHSF